ncbi:radical SAM protein [Methanocorpusculum sp. MG]|uniref:Radical SAM protein n=1 Tax=Methanocorpusculum petauri TaxID=3002863 RepID=A0ABT4IHS6_9EURY|nr:radical SAM protein [Methanocorpusculum petauri]MCZ0861305.1 radical SAM protein [Methanocorpusculum petauri]
MFPVIVIDMETETSINILSVLIGNPLSRRIISGMSQECEECGGNRLEIALEQYLGLRDDVCPRCRRASREVAFIIRAGARNFGVPEDEIKKTFRDAYWRKGLVSVMKGIAEFGVRRPFVPGAPFQVVWDVTHRCNLRCRHCYASAGKALDDELTTEEALHLIDRLAKLGVAVIAFSGGEPLVRPDILQLISHARDQGIYVALATNGTLITPKRADELRKAGAEYVQISIDGADAKTHDEFRGIPGAFDRTIEGVKNAVAAGFFVNISTTATKENYDQIPKIIDLCSDLGVNWVMAYNFVPTGRGQDMMEKDLSPQEREELLHMLYEKNRTSDCQVLTTAPQFARVALQQSCAGGQMMVPTHFCNQEVNESLLGLTEFVGGCGAGRFYMAIRANGDIDPCVFFPKTVGNVRTSDLEELWRHDPLFTDLRNKDKIEGSCGSCEYRYHCGGCRARAYGYFGNPLGPDPGCINNIEYYTALKITHTPATAEHAADQA